VGQQTSAIAASQLVRRYPLTTPAHVRIGRMVSSQAGVIQPHQPAGEGAGAGAGPLAWAAA
jgi:hypothetical protein